MKNNIGLGIRRTSEIGSRVDGTISRQIAAEKQNALNTISIEQVN